MTTPRLVTDAEAEHIKRFTNVGSPAWADDVSRLLETRKVLIEALLFAGVALSAAAEDIPDGPLSSRQTALAAAKNAADLLARLHEGGGG